MVGFRTESSTLEEEAADNNQVSKFKTLKGTFDPFDFANFAFADSFIDFEDIREYFEDSPDRGRSDFEKGMEVGDSASFVKTACEGLAFDGSNSVVDESKENGAGTGLVGNAKGARVELEEEMGKVSLISKSSSVPGDVVSVQSETVGSSAPGDMVSVKSATSGSSVPGDVVNMKSETVRSFVPGDVVSVKSEKVGGEERVVTDNMVYGLGSCVLDGDVVKSNIVNGRAMSKEDESESDSESENESSSSLSSSSSDGGCTSSDDDDDGEEVEEQDDRLQVKREILEFGDIEEGEIRGDIGEAMSSGTDDVEEEDGDKMVKWSDVEFDDHVEEDEDDKGAAKGPVRSKNELQTLPPVPAVDITLEPHHQLLPVGVVLSMVGPQVIVEGMEKHNPLNEGSILWITDTRSPLGIVDEIFGPVKNPYYAVRYNSENEVPSGIHNGTLISFVPEFADHVLSDKNLYKKGYDASGENDEEVSEEAEFSDDEKEAEYRRMLKMSKRGTNDQTGGKRRNNRKKGKNWEGNWNNNRPLGQQIPTDAGQLPPNQKQHNVSAVGASMNPNCGSSSFASGQDFSGRIGFAPPFPPVMHTTGVFVPPSGMWVNGAPGFHGAPVQPQSGVISAGFPANMPWPSQNMIPHPCQMPMPNNMTVQQQFDPSQGPPPNAALSGGQLNFYPGPAHPPWPAVGGQSYFNQTIGFQVQPSPLTTTFMNMGDSGRIPNALHAEQQSNSHSPPIIPDNTQAPQQFRAGASSSQGRKPYRRGGGRFAGGRARRI